MSDVHVMHQITTTRHTRDLRAGHVLCGPHAQPLGVVQSVAPDHQPGFHRVTIYLFRSEYVVTRIWGADEPSEVFWHADIEK